MNCDHFKTMMMAYLDGELSPEDREQYQAHLADCQTCKRELDEFAKLKEELTMMKFKEPSDIELDHYWRSVYNRLERRIGWALFSAGSIILLCYGGYKLIEEIVKDPTVSAVMKVGVVAAMFGAVILFVSSLRERLAVRKVDKYSKEVER